jgi:hypothetical protein
MQTRLSAAVCVSLAIAAQSAFAEQSATRLPATAAPESVAPAAARPGEQPEKLDLAGRWLLTLPAGYQYRITLEAVGENRYRFPSLAFAGVYELKGQKLVMVEPVDKRMTIFDWTINNVNNLTLTDETGASGARYVGATLGRQIDWEAENLPRQIATPVRPALRLARPLLRLPLAPTVRKDAEIRGKAFNDAERGPYIETEDTIVFVNGIDMWPADVLEQVVIAKGSLRRERITDAGEALIIQVLDMEKWDRGDQAADPPQR